MKNKVFVRLAIGVGIIVIGFGGLVYKTNFTDKAKLMKCADINLIMQQLWGGLSKKLEYQESLKVKLLNPAYEKIWDNCHYELKNSPIKFYEKYPGEFNYRKLFR